ncbi:MAG: hypothetical protein SFZ24_01290 [Planctomycetota bacterium]|nr:hypothetical protein [Planctomycetota bacterium]
MAKKSAPKRARREPASPRATRPKNADKTGPRASPPAGRTSPSKPAARRPAAQTSPPTAGGSPVLLILIVPSKTVLSELVPMLIDLGVDATILESRRLSTVLREDLPIFSGLASMLPDAPGGRLILSITDAAHAHSLTRTIEDANWRGPSPILATIALSTTSGLRR